jgi:hypothetical protein
LAATSLPGGGPPTPDQVNAQQPGQQSVSVVPPATYDTALTHDLHPLQFAGVLTILGLVWFTLPGRYHWPLAAALILGSLVYANDVADKEYTVRPIDLFSSLLTGKGL